MLVLLVQSVLHKNQPDHNNLFFPLLEFVDIEFVGLEFVGIEFVDFEFVDLLVLLLVAAEAGAEA